MALKLTFMMDSTIHSTKDSCATKYLYIKTADGQLKEEPEEVQWAVSDMSLNTFMKLCEQIPCDKLVGIGFSSAMKSMHNSPFNPTKWED